MTDFCDTAPSQGAMAGPCCMAACQSGDPLTSTSVIELEGVLALPPVYIYACDDDPKCTFRISGLINLASDHPTFLCDIQEVLPNAVGMVAGAGRGLTALVTLNLVPVCVDSTGYTGYVDKAHLSPVRRGSCIDVDDGTDRLGCAGYPTGASRLQLHDEPVEYPPGTVIHTGEICQDLVPTAAAAGHGLVRNRPDPDHGGANPPNPCDPATLIAAGEPAPVTLTTHAASGNLWDAGPLTSGAPLGGLIIEPGNFRLQQHRDRYALRCRRAGGGALNGAMVTSFATVATDPAASIGAQITKVVLDCHPVVSLAPVGTGQFWGRRGESPLRPFLLRPLSLPRRGAYLPDRRGRVGVSQAAEEAMKERVRKGAGLRGAAAMVLAACLVFGACERGDDLAKRGRRPRPARRLRSPGRLGWSEVPDESRGGLEAVSDRRARAGYRRTDLGQLRGPALRRSPGRRPRGPGHGGLQGALPLRVHQLYMIGCACPADEKSVREVLEEHFGESNFTWGQVIYWRGSSTASPCGVASSASTIASRRRDPAGTEDGHGSGKGAAGNGRSRY